MLAPYGLMNRYILIALTITAAVCGLLAWEKAQRVGMNATNVLNRHQ